MIQGAVVSACIVGVVICTPSVVDTDHVACRFIHEEKGVGGIGTVVAGVVVNHHHEVGCSVIVIIVIKVDSDPSVGDGDVAVIHLDGAVVQIDEVGEHGLFHGHQVEGDVAVAGGGGAMEGDGLQIPGAAQLAGRVNLL